MIKIKVLTDKERDFSYVKQWYKDIGIDLVIVVSVVGFNLQWVESVGQSWKVSEEFTDMNLCRYATGYDILAVVVDRKEWKRSEAIGYISPSKRLGMWRTYIQDTGKERRRKKSALDKDKQYQSTLIHEISHILHRETGKKDITHDLDDAGNLHKMKINIARFTGWKIKNATRLFKVSRGKIKEKIVYDRQRLLYKSGIMYWKKIGGYSELIP